MKEHSIFEQFANTKWKIAWKKDYRLRILKYFIVTEERKNHSNSNDSNDNVDENVRKTGKKLRQKNPRWEPGSHFTNIYFTLSKHEQSFKSLGA